MTVLGIDPGTKGHLAWLYAEASPDVERIPYGGKFIDVEKLCRMFASVADFCIVEKPSARPKQAGVESLYGNYHRILTVLTLCRVPYDTVTPQVWQKKLLGQTNKGDKAVCVAKARQLFPMVEDMTADKADALLIAEYARRLRA